MRLHHGISGHNQCYLVKELFNEINLRGQNTNVDRADVIGACSFLTLSWMFMYIH